MKKKLLFGLSLAAVAAASVGMTYALLQDETDVAVNVMTVGDVSIEQLEYQRKDKSVHVTNYANEGDLIFFDEQAQVVLPSVSKNGVASDYTAEGTDAMYCWGDYVTKEEGVGCNGLWNPAKVENVIDKIVMVHNTGTTDAYFRTLIAYESPEGMEIGEIPQGADMMINVNAGWYNIETVGYITYEGTRYLLASYTYTGNNGVLTADETARPSLLQMVFAEELTSNELMAFGRDGYRVLVATQAVQTSDLLTPEEALNKAFGEITTENHPFVTPES